MTCQHLWEMPRLPYVTTVLVRERLDVSVSRGQVGELRGMINADGLITAFCWVKEDKKIICASSPVTFQRRTISSG